jgi:hypothetical protein
MKTKFTRKAGSFFSILQRKRTIASCKSFVTFFIFLFSFSVPGQSQPPVPAYPSLTFNSPSLISGTDLQVNAVYNFPGVMTGVDAHVTIMGMSGGAWLAEIDNTTGAGYYDAFQPYVGAGANDTSYIDWKFVFKKAGTNTDTILPLLAVTGVDVDGDASALKEFISAATPGSFALDANTYLNFSFDGVKSTAISTIDNYPLIDTANTRSMFQMNFTNINTILYRNGAITTGGSQIRQTSIYFKSFFNFMTLLPVKILSFDAKSNNIGTDINWTASEEEDLKNYTVQKSIDGVKWKDIATVTPATSGSISNYSVSDLEKNTRTAYYRLQQKATNGTATYSKVVTLIIKNQLTRVMKVSATGNTINVQANTAAAGDYILDMYTTNGVKILQAHNKFYNGTNQYNVTLPQSIGKGIYIVVIKSKSGELIYNTKIPVI